MSLSAIVKKKFEARMGLSIDELSNSAIQTKNNRQETPNDYGRGYVHFGCSVNPQQKEKENLEILRNW